MDPWNWIWIALILVAFLPTIQQKLLKTRRQVQISSIEKERDSRVILLVHRQEAMRFLGFPLMRYIDINDSEEVLRAVQMTDEEKPIDLVLHTPGGLVLASLQIARAIKQHPAEVTVFVPHLAMSGGTLIALAADNIVMSPHASLGPVDPQIQQSPAASIVNVVKNKPISEIDDQTLIDADTGQKALRQLRLAVEELLKNNIDDEEKRKELADLLSRGAWTHDYPLHHETLTEMGLPVSKEMPENVYELLSLYPQPLRQQSSVEYLPTPRRNEERTPTTPS
jgi:ClpP class serine protease